MPQPPSRKHVRSSTMEAVDDARELGFETESSAARGIGAAASTGKFLRTDQNASVPTRTKIEAGPNSEKDRLDTVLSLRQAAGPADQRGPSGHAATFCAGNPAQVQRLATYHTRRS